MPRLYREIKQAKAYSNSGEEFLVTLVYTTEVVRHAMERALAPLSISPEQFNALRILRGALPGGHPTLEIARRMISRSPNISRMLGKLISKGLARRHRDRDDRRVLVNEITPRGMKLLARADRAVAKLTRRLTRGGRSLRSAVRVLDDVRGRARVKTARERAGLDPLSD